MVLLPEGSDLSLAELREMAARQQQQIEAQQHLLVAKEQRLKFLKQQEARHQQNFAQPREGLRLLRDKVEGQELKLRRLRALRGQVDQQRATNGNLTSELESTRALFNEKEKELSLAVAKVEELTRQLEELRSGNLNGLLVDSSNISTLNTPSVAELEKLRRELLYRTKLNEQQNARIQHQRETLAKRQEEVSKMDQRIAELQQRIQRKHNLNQQLSNNIHSAAQSKHAHLQRSNQSKVTNPRLLSTNVAAVEPLKRIPQESDRCHDDMKLKGNQTEEDFSEFGLKKNDPKYQTLPYNTKFTVKSNKDSNGSGSGEESDKPELIIPNKGPESKVDKTETANLNVNTSNGSVKTQKMDVSPTSPPPSKIQPPHSISNLAPRPFGSTYNSTVLSTLTNIRGHLSSTSTTPSTTTVTTTSSSISSGPSFPTVSESTISVPSSKAIISNQFSSTPTKVPPPSTSLLSPRSKLPTSVTMTSTNPALRKTSPTLLPPHNDTAIIQAQRRSEPEALSLSSSPESKSSSTGSLENIAGDGDKNKPALPPKPLIPVKPIPPPRQTHVVGVAGTATGKGTDIDSALLVLKGTGNKNLTTTTKNGNGYRYVMKSVPSQSYASRLPVGAATMDQYTKAINHVYRTEMQNQQQQQQQQQQQHSTASDSISGPVSSEMEHTGSDSPNDLESFRKSLPGIGQLPIRPKPLTIKKPSGLDPPRLRASITNGNSLILKRQSDSNGNSGSIPSPSPVHSFASRRIEPTPSFIHNEKSSSPISERLDSDQDETDKSAVSQPNLNTVAIGLKGVSLTKSDSEDFVKTENDILDNYNSVDLDKDINLEQQRIDEENNILKEMRKKLGIFDPDDCSPDEDVEEGSEEGSSGQGIPQLLGSGPLLRRSNKKGNLKTKGSSRHPRRVSFDPLALLLDASLEGELELVKKTAKEVSNPSAANDEGITALHNAICAGHLEIVKFLVEFGCDVNAKDSDGWTPLHCAASCNNLVMVKFLVEHGACIFATTLSDHETAAEKCEEDEEGFDGCSEYLYSVQEKLGILNGGAVYAVYDYEAQNPDELSFKDSDLIVVLRKGDDLEREWWWSKLRDREGYVPRNLLGLHPRVAAKTEVQ